MRIELRETVWESLAGALQSLGLSGRFLILARLASAEQLGRNSLAVAVTAPASLAARMQMRQAAADPQGGAWFGSCRRLGVISAAVSLAAVGLFAQTLQAESCRVVCAVALVRWSEETGDIHYAPTHGRATGLGLRRLSCCA